MVRLVLTATALHALAPLVAAGRHGRERVAFLHGSKARRAITVTDVEPVENTHRNPGGFGVSAADFRRATAAGSLVGLFHTHVGDCRPSDADVRLLRRTRLLQIIGAPGVGTSTIQLRSLYVSAGRVGSPPIEVLSS